VLHHDRFQIERSLIVDFLLIAVCRSLIGAAIGGNPEITNRSSQINNDSSIKDHPIINV